MPDLLEMRYPTRGARAAFDTRLSRLPRGWASGLDLAANIAVEELAHASPVGDHGAPSRGVVDQGQISRGWRVRSSGSGSQSRRGIYNTQWYLRLILRGRGAIDQTKQPPDRRWPLHFWYKGQELYRWRVKAAAPQTRWLLNARSNIRRRIRRELPPHVHGVLTRQTGP